MNRSFPFSKEEFLSGLKNTRCVGGQSGWDPILEHLGPFYIKHHSYGEFIFDWAVADLYQRLNLPYYPKLLSMIPFTPVSGPKFLKENFLDESWAFYENNNLSSFHLLFLLEKEFQELSKAKDFIKRWTIQFHWKNRSYESFEHYLDFFKQRKRKNIKKERRSAKEFDIEVLEGDQIQREHMAKMYEFYLNTILKKYSYAYLTQDFFHYLYEHMRKDIVLMIAKDKGQAIAASLNFKDQESLYGRYWGISLDYEERKTFLHFELCYYQLIEYCIEKQLKKCEVGAGGGHKLDRGFLPEFVLSLHHFKIPQVQQAFQNHCREEAKMTLNQIKGMTGSFPFREEALSTLYQLPEIF